MMELNIGCQVRESMEQVINVSWKHQVEYLGVKIISSLQLNKLISLNITPLLREMQGCFAQWDSLGISGFGRIQAVKMKLLPTFIFGGP